MTVRLSERGQIVIPSSIRKKLKLVKDQEFEVSIEGEKIVFSPIEIVSKEKKERFIKNLESFHKKHSKEMSNKFDSVKAIKDQRK